MDLIMISFDEIIERAITEILFNNGHNNQTLSEQGMIQAIERVKTDIVESFMLPITSDYFEGFE